MAHSPESPTANKTLIVGPAWIGDMVMAQSLFKLLHRQGQRLTVLAPEWTRPLLARMPEVENTLSSPFQHGELALLQRRHFARQLRDQQFQRAIVLPNSFKSALIPWFASIPQRIGWRGEWRDPILTDSRPLDKAGYPLMVQRFMALAYPPAMAADFPVESPQLQVDRGQLATLRERYGLPEQPIDTMAICPGAEFGEAKQWPAEYWAELVNTASRVGISTMLFGSDKDRQIASVIAQQLDQSGRDSFRDLAGSTSLADAIDLMSGADVCVSNDSGLMHVAAALSVPVVAIYGSTSADFTPPLGDKVKLLSTDIECRPCFQRSCPLGHLRCLREIMPDQVLASAQQLLGNRTRDQSIISNTLG